MTLQNMNTLPVLDVLYRLGAGDSLQSVASVFGLSDESLRACFRIAAERVRQTQARSGASLDLQTMSVSEALGMLASYAIKQGKPG